MYYHTMKKTPDLSVVIASHRREMIADLLGELEKQALKGYAAEVIIVTDYPSGSLQQQFTKYIWLFVDDVSISRKRNCGVNIASGAIIAFTDDDCFPDADWMQEGISYLEEHVDTAAVIGKTTIQKPVSVKDAGNMREFLRLEKPAFRTNNLFIRSEVFRDVGGFDERFTVQREDLDLGFTLLENGYVIDYSEAMNVVHRYRTGERYDLLKNCWNRRFDPLLYKKHPHLFRKELRTSFTPSMVASGVSFVLAIILLRKKQPSGAVLTLFGTNLLLGIRRTGWRPGSIAHLFAYLLQDMAAPIITLAALLYGSVRFKKLYLF